jgi:excisionase family DNA binding protein
MRTTTSSSHPQTQATGAPSVMPSPALPKLLTVDATAEALTLSPKSIRRMIDRGDLPVHRIGRAIRIAEPDVIAYLAQTRK